MGQQQLLLVILVTIIVGIATVVAINVFGTSAESANRDAVRQDILTIAAAAQGWYIKPIMMAGGGNSFVGITFHDINFSAELIDPVDSADAINMNGRYSLSAASATQVTIEAHPASDENYDAADSFTATAGAPMEATIIKDGIVWVSN